MKIEKTKISKGMQQMKVVCCCLFESTEKMNIVLIPIKNSNSVTKNKFLLILSTEVVSFIPKNDADIKDYKNCVNHPKKIRKSETVIHTNMIKGNRCSLKQSKTDNI